MRLLELKRDEVSIEQLGHWGELEAKFADDKAEGEIEGYASIFGEVDQGNDIVVKGAFAKSLRDPTTQHIPLFFGHIHNSVPIGVLTSLKEDSKGLPFKAKLILETPESRQVRAILLAGGKMGVSIGYVTKKARWKTGDGKMHDEWQPNAVRELVEVELREISLTAMPMLKSAGITKVKGEGDETAAPIRALETVAHHLEIRNALGVLRRALES